MRHFFVFLMIISFIYSCKLNPAKINLTQNEKKALDSISSVYGSEISYSKKLPLLEKEKKGLVCSIELGNSNTLSKFSKYTYLPPSNAALIFYSLISDKDRNKYFKYEISVEYGEKIRSYEYSKDELDSVYNCTKEAKDIIDLLKKENYDKLKSKISVNEIFQYDLDILLKGIKKTDSVFGKIRDSEIAGFTFNTTESGYRFVKVYGIFYREKQDSFFSIYIDPMKKDVFKIDYKW